jgi:hypothetical protein
MNRWSASLALAGMAVLLSGCVYYPNGPEGPGYGPYRSGYNRPPPGPGYDGPPPPPPQGQYAPPPQQQQGYAPPPQQQGYAQQGPDSGQQASRGPSQRQIAHMNDPNWCAANARKCQRLQSKFGQGGQGPSGGAQEGPPPPGSDDESQ